MNVTRAPISLCLCDDFSSGVKCLIGERSNTKKGKHAGPTSCCTSYKDLDVRRLTSSRIRWIDHEMMVVKRSKSHFCSGCF